MPTGKETTQCTKQNCFKSSFAHRFFSFQGPRLYNIVDNTCKITEMVRWNCKKTVSAWFHTKTYY